MVGTPTLGFQDKLYYDSGGGTFVEIDVVQDLEQPDEADEVEVTTRGHGGFKAYRAGHFDIRVTGTMLDDPLDTAFAFLQTNYRARTSFLVRCMNGDNTDTDARGVEFTAQVSNFSQGQPLADANTRDFTLVSTGDTVPTEVSGGP